MKLPRLMNLAGKPFYGMGKLLSLLGPIFINSRLSLVVEPTSRFLLPLAYTFKYAKWYTKNSIKEYTLQTRKTFGYGNRYELYGFLVRSQNLEQESVSYLEFGVASGDSLRWWVQNNKNSMSRFIGFDTFSGLPENWGTVPKGTFSTGGSAPALQDLRCSYQIGLFQDTLFGFLQKFSLQRRRTIVHLDADLYSSTLFVLATIAPKLKQGDIIIFDEFADVMHEFRAYLDFISAFRVKLKVLNAVNYGNKVAFLVAEP